MPPKAKKQSHAETQRQYDALRSEVYAAYNKLGEFVKDMHPADATVAQKTFAAEHPKDPAFIKGTPEAKARMAEIRSKTKSKKVTI